MQGEEFKACVIGLGRIGWKWEVEDLLQAKPCTHVGAYCHVPGVELVAVCDINTDLLSRFREYCSGVKTYTDYLEMVEEEKPNIVSVATPVDTHFHIVSQLLETGIPDVVFCEKPLARTVQECKEIVRLSSQHGIPIVVNHTRRWSSVWEYVKREVATEGVVRFFLGKYTGHWLEVGVHMADLYFWLADKARDIVVNVNLPYLLFEVEIYTDNTVICVKGNGAQVERYVVQDSDRYTGIKDAYIGQVVFVRGMEVLTPMYRAVMEIVSYLRYGTTIRCTARDGLRAVEKCSEWGERFGFKVPR